MRAAQHGLRVTLAAVIALLAGCASPAAEALQCDEAGVVLGYQRLAEGPLYDGMSVHVENGWPFLFVDGECRYWAYSPAGRTDAWWSDVHTGRLSEGLLEELNSQVWTRDWTAVDGARVPAPPDVADGGMRWLWRRTSVGACGFDCELAPEPMRVLVDELESWTARLYATGAPFMGEAVRVSSYRVESSEHEPVMWLGRQSPAMWEADAAVRFGGSALVRGEDAVLLRELRQAHISGGYAPFAVVVRDGEELWALNIREALPFENDEGLVRPSEM